ncbi:MAG TPA: TolC family protein [Gemmatimonadaceae bacterium]|nr:TolC family protein [Gemmatimonadaceae bacterium]
MSRYALVAVVCNTLVAGGIIAPAVVMAQAPTQLPVVTLEEARRRASVIDPAAVEATSRVETAVWERRAAMANVLTPNVRAGLNYTHFSDPFFNFGTGAISPNATSATLEASYTLLGAGKLGDLRSARASLESAEASETAARFRTALETDAAYYAVLANGELNRVAQDRLKRAEEQFGVARVRVLAGEAIASDSLQLLLEVNRARLALLSRDSALVASRLGLGRQIGLSGPADAAPIDTALLPPLPMAQEEAVAEMRERGPDVLAARAAERGADAVLLAMRERYFPEITLGAIAGAYDSELFPSALSRTQLAVTVSLPIWNGGQRELAVSRARAERNVARAERQDSERATAETMAQSYHGYTTARAGVELALVGVAVSGENYRVQRARYREGATTILDLLEAQVALSEAEATLVQARYATRLALARIEALLGRRIFEE